MKLITLLACFVFVFGSALDSVAQYKPVIAKQTTLTYKIHPDGSETVEGRTEGTYFRSSSGSEMSTSFDIKQGRRVGKGESTFIDSATGKAYSLYHDSKHARLRHVRSTPFHPPKTKPTQVLGKAVVSGLNCLAIPTRRGKRQIGKVWVSSDPYLLVKREYEIPPNRRQVWTLHDIQFAEPDSSKFSFPADYTIDDSECAPCKEASPDAGK